MSDEFQMNAGDRAIIRALQQDCRLSNAQLAERVGMSASACWRRVRALEEAGVIAGYGAVIDADRAGLGFHAIVHVTLARHDRSAVQAAEKAIANPLLDEISCKARMMARSPGPRSISSGISRSFEQIFHLWRKSLPNPA